MRIEKFPSALALIGAVAFTGGCVAHARATTYGETDAPVANVDNATLVEIDPGVWVVRDYDEPVYFVNDEYWVYRNGAWYRSHAYQGGWVAAEATVVPPVIVRRDHRAYIHYHGAPAAQTRAAPHRGREMEHQGRPAADTHPGEPHHDEAHHDDGHHDDGHGPGNERKTEERHDGHEHDTRAEHQEGHDHDQGRANDDQRRGDGKKNDKDKDKDKDKGRKR